MSTSHALTASPGIGSLIPRIVEVIVMSRASLFRMSTHTLARQPKAKSLTQTESMQSYSGKPIAVQSSGTVHCSVAGSTDSEQAATKVMPATDAVQTKSLTIAAQL